MIRLMCAAYQAEAFKLSDSKALGPSVERARTDPAESDLLRSFATIHSESIYWPLIKGWPNYLPVLGGAYGDVYRGLRHAVDLRHTC